MTQKYFARSVSDNPDELSPLWYVAKGNIKGLNVSNEILRLWLASEKRDPNEASGYAFMPEAKAKQLADWANSNNIEL